MMNPNAAPLQEGDKVEFGRSGHRHAGTVVYHAGREVGVKWMKPQRGGPPREVVSKFRRSELKVTWRKLPDVIGGGAGQMKGVSAPGTVPMVQQNVWEPGQQPEKGAE